MRFLAGRLVRLVPVLVAVTLLSYLLLDLLPSDPTIAILGPGATEEARAELADELGLDDPFPVRYAAWMGDVVTGDLGRSYVTGQPVTEAIGQRIGITLELLVAAQLVALLTAVPLGIMAAQRPDGWLDRLTAVGSFALLSTPAFVGAVVLVLIFSVNLGWLPATGLPPFSEAPADHVRALVLPVVTLAAALAPVYLRLVRTEMLATLQEDYILAARAKGLPRWHILVRHALRPSSFSLVTVAGLNVAALVGGAVITETVFALSGMGSLAVQSIRARDYLMVQGVVLVVAVGYVLVNFAVDIVYAILDPRIRRGHTRS